jgi:Zn-dependent protease
MMNLDVAVRLLPGLVIGLSLHEFAHAWSASLLGDNFARRQGRVSLNPFRHLSITGTLAILLLPMGWGKPVMINLYNFKHPKRDYLITSLAGPMANIFIVLACLVLAQFTRHDMSFGDAAQPYLAGANETLTYIALINGIMATFNLLPIPPLDGSKIWPVLLPGLKPSFGSRGVWISFIVIIFLLQSGYLRPIFDFTLNSTAYYMPNTDSDNLQHEQTARLSERAKAYADHHNAAVKAYHAENYAEAENQCTRALEIEPDAHIDLFFRSMIRQQVGKLTAALADIDRAIELKKDETKYVDARKSIMEALDRAPE